jgi:transcriptional regulator with XRE-family HTH domain
MNLKIKKWKDLSNEKYSLIAAEIIRQLRGETSQRDLSQRLGFSFNQIGKWESGVTQIKFEDFLNVCFELNISVEEKFRKFFAPFDGPFNEKNCLLAIEKYIKHEEIENFKNTFLNKVNLSDVLHLLDLRSSLLFGWLSQFIDCQKMLLIQPYFNLFQKKIDIVQVFPKSIFVNAAIQLDIYKKLDIHDEGLLAFHSLCTTTELREILNHLVNSELIYYNGLKYEANSFEFSFSFLAYPSLRGMTKVATDIASQKYSLIPSSSIKQNPENVVNFAQSTFRTAAISKEASLKIRNLMLNLHIQLGEIIDEDQGPKDNVQIIIAHSYPTTINSNPLV